MARYQYSRRKESLPPSRKPTSDFLQPRPFPPIPEAQESAPSSLNPNIPPPQFSIAAPQGSRPHPLQPKLTLGAPGDKYEQEADHVASQVVQHINSPTINQANPAQSVQRETLPEEGELQMKPMLQREPLPEDDELQMKSALSTGIVEGDASPNLEATIQQSRGRGQALAPDLQTKMGQAMGADFSHVRIHTDSQSDQLNRSIQAKAFTTGQDIFFRQGAYQPGNQGGQELIAHELTHVVQQNGDALQRRVQDISSHISMAIASEHRIQRADGLPNSADLAQDSFKAGKKMSGKTLFAQILDALDFYRDVVDETNATEKQQQLLHIQQLIRQWNSAADKRKTPKYLIFGEKIDQKKDEPKRVKLQEVDQKIDNLLKNIVSRKVEKEEDDEKEMTPSVSYARQRRKGGLLDPSVHPKTRKEEPVKVLTEKLSSLGYKEDRNYMAFYTGETPHVGWKAHLGASPSDMSGIIDVSSKLLQKLELPHKFDISNDSLPEGKKATIEKFLTIYPPAEESAWATLLEHLEDALSEFGRVVVDGHIPVGKTGKVAMRHGQLTSLTVGAIKDLDVEPDGQLGEYEKYKGTDIVGDGLPLLSHKGTLFFSQTQAAPEKTSPNHIYMAIRYGNKIIPDKREEANPAKAPLPTGVKEYED